MPTPTPLSYQVVANDSCLAIAAHFDVSVESIRSLNNLGVDCVLSIGKTILIPQPTPTATALPSATLGPADQTEAACKKDSHTVTDTDTLSKIAQAYGVTMQSIKDANGLPSDTVYVGTTLTIPLCQRATTNGPTPTPTSPPPYAGPNLLLPADGAPFGAADDSVTLQWASVGTLRDNEAYAVTIEDVTEGQARKLVDYVTDTKYIVPASFRPNDASPHVLRWWVMVARKTGTTAEGNPIWEPAGNQSTSRDFTWSGSGAQPTATQAPN
jgi:LysM repeat protein